MTRLLARLLLLTRLVDRGYRLFDRLRSTLVLATASDRMLDAYNALAYGATSAYDPTASDFRRGLFDWEQQAIDRYFPPAPARLLLGGAGGGREAFALLERGYEVVAFDPADRLVESMRRAHRGHGLRAYCGGYADLPRLREPDGTPIDLSRECRFDAAILGWSSFAHILTDAERSAALRAMAALTGGPILLSYFPDPAAAGAAAATGGGVRGWLRRRALRRGRSVFSVQIGYYRLLRPGDIEGFAREAGLEIVGAADDANFPYVVFVRRADASATSD